MTKTTIAAALAGLVCAAPALPAGTIEVAALLHDGQISRVSGASFDGPHLRLYGRDWADWSRVFLQFDLAALSGLGSGAVQSAKLRLAADAVENPDGKAIGIYRITVPWTPDATWDLASTVDQAAWPQDENRNANIDHAAGIPLPEPSATAVITADGPVEIDVTDLVKAWLDGEPDHGLMLRVGPTIWGIPGDMGNWNFEFLASEAGRDGPVLEIVTGGDPARP